MNSTAKRVLIALPAVSLLLAFGALASGETVDALLRRSLVLARRAHPALAGVSVSSGGILVGIDNTPRGGAALQEGAIAIVSQFIELLVVLIGEDLAMLLVRDIWPLAAEEDKK